MATKEHQGLQIAVMIFFMLTVALGVTTFYGFSNARDEGVKVKAEQEKASKADTDRAAAMTENESLKELVGHKPEEPIATVSEAFAKDMAATGLDPDDKAKATYRNAVAVLSDTLSSTNKSLATANTNYKSLETKAAEDQKAAEDTIAKYLAAMNNAVKEKEAVESQYKQQLAGSEKAYSDAKTLIEQATTTLTAEKGKLTKEVAQLKDENRQLQNIKEGMQQRLQKITQTNFERVDGKITYVNQRANSVYINLGLESGLRGRVTFSVYNPEDLNVETATPKAKIEVIGTPQASMAEARILEHDLANPILPGDMIYSPVWEGGVAVRFALAGNLDIDGDTKSDAQKVRDLIRRNGGLIDAEIDDNGKVIGTMSVQTRYLVMGDRPTEKDKPEHVRSFSTLIDQAKTLGVEQINILKFLDSMGYTATAQVTSAEGAAAGGSGFRSRQPPARGKNGAF